MNANACAGVVAAGAICHGVSGERSPQGNVKLTEENTVEVVVASSVVSVRSDPVSSPAAVAHLEVAGSALPGRLGRVMGGGVLLLGPVIVIAQYSVVKHLDRDSGVNLAPLLGLLWVAAVAARQLGVWMGRRRDARGGGDNDALARASFVVPALGLAVSGPLSLHAVVGLPVWFVGVVSDDRGLIRAFDEWVGLCLVGTVHVHLAFAVAMAFAASRVVGGEDVRSVTLWPAVALSCIPGIILIFPPVLVFVCGLIISQLFLRLARKWRRRDDAAAV